MSKEAEADLDDLHEERENVIAVEEAFERDLLERKRERMEQLGALHRTEMIQYDGETPSCSVSPQRTGRVRRSAFSKVRQYVKVSSRSTRTL